MSKRVRIIVSGRVQGVFFRVHTREQAVRLGLTGFVRNLGSGAVEIVAEGDSAALEALLRWARVGPPMAHVEDVNVSYASATGEFDAFEVRG